MKYTDYKILTEAYKKHNGCFIIGLKGGNSYICADYIEAKEYNELNDNEKRFLNDNMLRYNKKDLEEANFSIKENIEGTKVKLEVLFYEEESCFSSKINYVIKGQKNFRKENKKTIYNELLNKVKNMAKNTAKDLNDYKKEYENTIKMFNNIRKTFAVLKNMGYTEEQIINAAKNYLNYENAENKIDYLKEKKFSGLENLGVHNTKSDGFGHETITYTDINFLNKNITIAIGNSSD